MFRTSNGELIALGALRTEFVRREPPGEVHRSCVVQSHDSAPAFLLGELAASEGGSISNANVELEACSLAQLLSRIERAEQPSSFMGVAAVLASHSAVGLRTAQDVKEASQALQSGQCSIAQAKWAVRQR